MKHLLLILILLLTLTSCSKDENGENGDPNQDLIFSSLTAQKTVIALGESTRITAVASGYKITYKWSSSLGGIMPANKPEEAIFAGSPCTIGLNKVTCTVRDGNNNYLSKDVSITVQ